MARHPGQWQIEIKLLIFQTRTKPPAKHQLARDSVNQLDNLSRDATATCS